MNQELIHKILKEKWGFEQFRAKQVEIINSVLIGKDTLALLPTGGGKSICYQVPALASEGICVVVSPLIALMEDQVLNLKKKGIKAEVISSAMSRKAIDITLDNAIYGNLKFIYVSPERLKSRLFLQRFKKMNVNLIAIDEAHCISQWGYDFRPAYLEIAKLRELKPDIPFLALTATATADVVKDIQDKLQFKNENVIKRSFNRDNLIYSTHHCSNKRKLIEEYLSATKGSGIIYCSTRRNVKELCKHLLDKGFSADFYHAGLDHETRSKKQSEWIENKTRIIISTNAFGMGIDKPDVRFVLHFDIPETIEAYFQEAGRAGRDEKDATATLFFEDSDIDRFKEKAKLKYPEIAFIKNVYKALGNHFQLALGAGENESMEFDINSFCDKYSFEILKTYNAFKILEVGGYIVLSESIKAPAKVKILADKMKLYQEQTRNENVNKVIQFILRTEMNVFDDYARVNFFKISQATKLNQKIINDTLNYLNKLELVDYVPSSEKPKITYLTARLKDEDIFLAPEVYHKRKQIHEQKTDAMLSYLNSSQCRNVFLLNYFDDHTGQNCGKCSACLENQGQQNNDSLLVLMKPYISLELKENEKIDTKDLIQKFSEFSRNDVLNTLRWMSDNRMIKFNDQGKTISKS